MIAFSFLFLFFHFQVAESEGIFDVQVTNDALDASVDKVKNLIMTRLRAKNHVVFVLGGPVFLMVYYFFPYHDAAPCEKPRCVCPRQSWKREMTDPAPTRRR